MAESLLEWEGRKKGYSLDTAVLNDVDILKKRRAAVLDSSSVTDENNLLLPSPTSQWLLDPLKAREMSHMAVGPPQGGIFSNMEWNKTI